MALKYKLYQVKNKTAKWNGKWGARAVMTGKADLATLSERIQRNCTVKRSDVLAVLTELVEVMRDELQNSHVVKLNGLGTFRICLSTKLAETEETFSITKNLKTTHVRFTPEVSGRALKGEHHNRMFLDGLKIEKWTADGKGSSETKPADNPGTGA